MSMRKAQAMVAVADGGGVLIEAKRDDFAAKSARRLDEITVFVRELKLLEVILGTMLIFELPMFGIPVPFNQIAVIALCAIALLRPLPKNYRSVPWLPVVLTLMLAYLTLVSVTGEISPDAYDWKRRIIRLAFNSFLLVVLISGRIDLRSIVVGYLTASFVNIPLFYLGLAPHPYGDLLTGFLGDKNVSGMVYASLPILALGFVKHRSTKVWIVLGATLATYLTDSRTSMAALASALLWIIFMRGRSNPVKWIAGLLIYIAVIITAEDFSQIGRYSNREGSDLLRSRIDAASELKVNKAGFFGQGLGEGVAYVGNKLWDFHNSYWTILVEGGWPWLILVLGIMAFAVIRPFARHRLDAREHFAQAAGISILICSWRLGEVLFTTLWVLIIAVGVVAKIEAQRRRTAEMVEFSDNRSSFMEAPVSQTSSQGGFVQ